MTYDSNLFDAIGQVGIAQWSLQYDTVLPGMQQLLYLLENLSLCYSKKLQLSGFFHKRGATERVWIQPDQ